MDERIDYGALVLADAVHSRVYTDQRIFEDELERLWGRLWLYVAHESEVAVPGDYVTRSLAGQPVIVVRSAGGDVRVLFNRCRHRGNSVCQAANGNASFFRCGYHGWTYANSGALVGVTHPAGYGPDFQKEQFGLLSVPRFESYRGFIFASLSPDVPSLAEHLGRAAETLDAYGDLSPEGEIEVRSGVQRHRYYGNWKIATENILDGYHLTFVHKSVVGDRVPPMEDPSVGAYQVLGSGNAWGFLRGTPKGGGAEGAGDKGGPTAFIADFPVEARDAYYAALAKRVGAERAAELVGGDAPTTLIFPNLHLITNEIRVIEPVSANETVVSFYATTAKGAPPEINSWRIRTQERSHGPAGIVAGDDMEMFERNQRGFAATGNPWVNLTRGLHREWQEEGLTTSRLNDETPIRAFWQRYKELMSQPPPLGNAPSAVLVEQGANTAVSGDDTAHEVASALDNDVGKFLYTEALLLDRHLYEEWMNLWTPDGIYWVPIVPNTSPGDQISIIYDDMAQLRQRVERFQSGQAWVQDPQSRLVRSVSNVHVAGGDGENVTVRSVQIVVEFRSGRLQLWPAHVEHALRRSENSSEYRIERKVAELVNSTDALPNLGFLL